MTHLRTAALALPLTLALGGAALAEGHGFETDEQEVSYAVGVLVGSQVAGDFGEGVLELQPMLDGIAAGFGEGEAKMTREEALAVFQAYREVQAAKMLEDAQAEADAFLAENASAEGVMQTESGLQYKVVMEGEGEMPSAVDRVSVHYTGRLIDGTVFDSSVARGAPAEFPVSGVVPGFGEALQLMKPGGKLEIWIPPALGYGERGAGGDIGPNQVLNFELELIEIVTQ
jgi:FKBP-type peptidyl-prolyl cis-trans isomerase